MLTNGPEGKFLVLVHGFLGRGRNLTTLARRLEARVPGLTVVLPDLPGHGDGPPLPPAADIEILGRALLGLDVPRPLTLVGHSLGGRAALAATLVDPDAVADVTLLDIAPGPILDPGRDSMRILELLQSAPREAPTREPFRAHLRAGGVPDALVEWQMLNLVHEQGVYRWRIDPEALARLHPRVNAADLWPALEAPGRRATMRCVRGGASPYVSDADVRRMAAAGCPVETFEGVGHFVHVQALDRLVDTLVSRLFNQVLN